MYKNVNTITNCNWSSESDMNAVRTTTHTQHSLRPAAMVAFGQR